MKHSVSAGVRQYVTSLFSTSRINKTMRNNALWDTAQYIVSYMVAVVGGGPKSKQIPRMSMGTQFCTFEVRKSRQQQPRNLGLSTHRQAKHCQKGIIGLTCKDLCDASQSHCDLNVTRTENVQNLMMGKVQCSYDWPHSHPYPHAQFQIWPGHGKMTDPPTQNFRFGMDMERWLTPPTHNCRFRLNIRSPQPLHERPFTREGNSLVVWHCKPLRVF